MVILQEPSWLINDVLDSKADIRQSFWPDLWICLQLYIQIDIFTSFVAQKLRELDLVIPQQHFLFPLVDKKDGPCSWIKKKRFS